MCINCIGGTYYFEVPIILYSVSTSHRREPPVVPTAYTWTSKTNKIMYQSKKCIKIIIRFYKHCLSSAVWMNIEAASTRINWVSECLLRTEVWSVWLNNIMLTKKLSTETFTYSLSYSCDDSFRIFWYYTYLWCSLIFN